jgi:hypothetical protein
MGTSSLRRDAISRLARRTGLPIALAGERDDARLDGLQLSISIGGLSQSQITDAPVRRDGQLWYRTLMLYHWLFTQCTG